MQVSMEEVEGVGRQMTIEVDPATAQQIGKVVARQASVPGFRRGKAPLAAVMRSLSPDDLTTAVGGVKETQAILEEALEENGVDASADAQLDSVAWDPLVLTVILPEEKAEEESAAEPVDSEE